jgi:hypothetical protein
MLAACGTFEQQFKDGHIDTTYKQTDDGKYEFYYITLHPQSDGKVQNLLMAGPAKPGVKMPPVRVHSEKATMLENIGTAFTQGVASSAPLALGNWAAAEASSCDGNNCGTIIAPSAGASAGASNQTNQNFDAEMQGGWTSAQ